jgi:hypothetical protein
VHLGQGLGLLGLVEALSTPQACFRFSCRASFIGSGSIWPEPEVEIITLNESGFCA